MHRQRASHPHMSRDSISGAQTQTPQAGRENYPNLPLVPAASAKGRGRLQRQINRCFVLFGPEVSATRLYDWSFVRNPRARQSQLHRWSVVLILRRVADRIGRAPTHGRPWIWRLKMPAAENSS
jgi:hypothetical protein